MKIKIPDFDPHEPVYWGARKDEDLTREELLTVIRYMDWKECAAHELRAVQHEVLMHEVYGIERIPQSVDRTDDSPISTGA